mgnify:CR=1 FL=1
MLKVDEWRRAKNVTKKDMANLLGITVPTYDKFERNPSKMSVGMAKKVAEILEVDFSDINFFAEQ